jgi:hypothetical protein
MERAIYKFFNLFIKVTPYISFGICFIHFSSSLILKGPFIVMFVQFLHIFGEKVL